MTMSQKTNIFANTVRKKKCHFGLRVIAPSRNSTFWMNHVEDDCREICCLISR